MKIAFANTKGGVTKTALTVHMAVFLAKLQSRVLVIDMDDQRSSYAFFNNGPYINTSAPMMDILDAQQMPTLQPHPERLIDVLYMDNESSTLFNTAQHPQNIMDLIAPLTNLPDYEIVIIDCPATKNNKNLAGLLLADHVIIPMCLAVEDYNGATETWLYIKDTVAQLRSSHPRVTEPNLVGFLPVRASKGHARTMQFSKIIAEEIGQSFLADAMLSHRPVVPDSIKDKIAIFDYKKGDPRAAREEMNKSMWYILNRVNQTADTSEN